MPPTIPRSLVLAGLLALPVTGPVIAEETTGIRAVTASPHGVIELRTRLRYTTMVVLPDREEILDVICGDQDFWVISATHNIVHVKPAQQGAATNLNLVTTSGAVYSFLLTEGHDDTEAPDLKVYVKTDATPRPDTPTYYSAAQVDGLRAELSALEEAVDAAHQDAAATIATFRQAYPGRLRFDYDTPKYRSPFFVRAIWHDGEFTYLKTDARELPALYERKDGRPALVNFQVHGDTYVVQKVMDHGYLVLGTKRVSFHRER